MVRRKGGKKDKECANSAHFCVYVTKRFFKEEGGRYFLSTFFGS